MKRIFFLLILLTAAFSNFSQNETVISLNGSSKEKKTEFNVTKNSTDGFSISLSIGEIKFTNYKKQGKNYIIPEIHSFVKSFDEGKPNIPTFIKLIELPYGAKVKFKIIDYDEQIIDLNDHDIKYPIIPAQRSQSKSEDEIALTKDNDIYEKDEFWFNEIVSFRKSGMMRSSTLGEIEISLIQYNPVQHKIKVINNIDIEVSFEDADHLKTAQLKKKYASPYFDDILDKFLINDLTTSQNKELISQSPVHYVIVSDRMFESQLETFIDWKIKKGFLVTVGYTDEIGTSTTDIHTWLQTIYEGSDPMSFVLFVGDVQQIPAYYVSSSGHYTDLRYCEYTGDNIPEVYYGRFSAQTTEQLQPQIDKTLLFEKYQMADPSYLENNVLVAGVDGSYATAHGNGAINYGTEYYFNAEHDINPLTYLYGDEENSTVMASNNSGASSSIIYNINSGVGFANYTAHCSPSGWANPSFSTANVTNLTNSQKYGLWIGNCCESVRFEQSQCFGEAGLRKADGGAIGIIGGSNNTYWDEDYWWGVGLKSGSVTANPTYEETGLGAYDGVFHDKDNEVNDLNSWYPAQGQINMAGNMAVQASSSGLKKYYWEIYHLMGDPSLMPYMGIPKAMLVNNTPESLIIGMTSLTVNSAPYTYVALSQNGVLIDAKVSDASGFVILNFAAENLNVGDADLVVTGQNKIPYIGTLTISPADEPYVVISDYSTGISPDYGQTVSLNVSMENLAETGSSNDAYNVESVLYEEDDFVTISDNSELYGTIEAGSVSAKDNTYEIILSDNVPDQHNIQFNIINEGNDINSDSYKWYSKLNLIVNAPKFTINELTVDDASGNGNGILDVGETADIIISVANSGHADANNVIAYLSTSDYNLILNNSSTIGKTLAKNEETTFVFNVTVSSTAERGSGINVEFIVREGESMIYYAESDFEISISGNNEYCDSYATSGADSRIDSVRFGNSIFNGTTDVGCSVYSDFTNLIADVFQGEKDTLIFVLGSCGENFQKGAKVFIDWNRDKDFDDLGEHIHTTALSTGILIDTVEVFIPEDAVPGKTRMRIVLKETTSISNIYACGTYSWGETEDYSLNIFKPISAGGSLISEDSRICSGSNTGLFNLINYTGTIDDWERRLDGGSWIPLGNNTDEFNETLNDPGLYEYRVSVNSGTSFSDTLLMQVDDLTSGGTLSAVSDICENENTGEIVLTGNIGYVQKWIKKLDQGPWVDINTSFSKIHENLNESGTWYYRTVVKNGTCEIDSSEISQVIVNSSAVAGYISPEEGLICTGDDINLLLNDYEGNIQWMESVKGIVWNEIPGENSDSYTTPLLTEDHYYKTVVTISGCADDETVKNVKVSENPVASFDYTANYQHISFTNTSTDAIEFSWDFGDGLGNSNNRNPEYSYTTDGAYTVSLEVSNGACPNDTYNEIINVSYVGIDMASAEFSVSPNPSDGIIKIDLSAFSGEKILTVYTVSGKSIYKNEISNIVTEIDLSNEKSGIYFINVISEGKSFNKKIIIK